MRNKVRLKRVIIRLKQAELAALLHVPQVAISQLETAARPQYALVFRLEHFLPLKSRTISLYNRIVNLRWLYELQADARRIEKTGRSLYGG